MAESESLYSESLLGGAGDSLVLDLHTFWHRLPESGKDNHMFDIRSKRNFIIGGGV